MEDEDHGDNTSKEYRSVRREIDVIDCGCGEIKYRQTHIMFNIYFAL